MKPSTAMITGSKDWWKNFLQKTSNLTSASVFKNCLNDGQIAELKSAIFDVLRKIQEPNHLRVYLDGKQNESYNKIIYENRPSENETFEAWSARVFKDSKFGIILNHTQDYSDVLAKKIHELVMPLLELSGLPLGGIEVTFFIGNYGYTPLGYHKDPIGHKVTHLHLGPGTKKMLLIEPDIYENDLKSLTDGKNGFKEFDKVAHHATTYEIKTGDIFFMPYGKYHVGYNPDLSAGITVWHIEPSKTELQNHLNLLFLKKIFAKESKEIIATDKGPMDSTDYLLNSLSDTVEIDTEYENLGLKNIFENLVSDYKLALRSNSYLASNAKTTATAEDQVTLDRVIEGNKPFQILTKKSTDDSIVLFIRGNRVVYPDNGGLGSLINRINKGERMKVQECIQPLLEDWDEDTAIYFINELHRHKAINLV